MTNKEKAKEITKDYAPTLENIDAKIVIYDAIMEMATWKDEQHNVQKQQLIEKSCEWLKNNIHDYYMTNEFEQWFDEMFDDFKKEMEE